MEEILDIINSMFELADELPDQAFRDRLCYLILELRLILEENI